MTLALFFVRMRLQQKIDYPAFLEPCHAKARTFPRSAWDARRTPLEENEMAMARRRNPRRLFFLAYWPLIPVMLLRVCFNVAEIAYFWESNIRLG